MDVETWLDSVLKKKASDESPLSVLETKSEAAVKKNDNYLSTLNRVYATVLLRSGKIRKITVLVKTYPTSQYSKLLTTNMGVFVREITMYRDIFPKMEDLMEECGMEDEPMWSKLYDVQLYDRLVMEDLTTRGYRMFPRAQQLDLTHCLLVVKNLAKFHGLSHVLLKRLAVPLDLFRHSAYKNIADGFTERNMSAYKVMLKEIDSWGNEWKEVRHKFEKAMPELTTRLFEAMEPHSSDFVVLNHGDCWKNNFLFRYSPDSEILIPMKFVDFQMCFIGPPSFDLDLLLAYSVSPENYQKHWDLIIQTYCDALKSTMIKLNFEGTVPDFTAMKTLMKRTHIIYLIFPIVHAPMLLSESENVDFEELLSRSYNARVASDGGESWNLSENLSGLAKTVTQFALRDAVECKLI